MKNIIQRISLEGGAAIKAELVAIGAAGQKAFGDLQGAIASNRAFGNIGAAIDSVKAKAAQLGAGAGQLGKDMGELGGNVTRVAGIFGVTLAGSIASVVAGIAKLSASSADVGSNLQKSADATGTTTDNLQALTGVAGKFNVSGEEIAKVLTRINGLADEQVKGNLNLAKSQADLSRQFARGEISSDAYLKSQRDLNEKAAEGINIFERLGVSATNADGTVKDSTVLFKEFATALANVPDVANRAGLALEITGKRNAGVNRIFNLGADGIDKFAKAVERAEPKLNTFQIATGNRLTVALNGLRGTIASVKNSIGLLFAPNETRLVSAFQDLIVSARGSLIDMANGIVTKVTPVVDDLIAVMQGRDKDVKNNIILVLRDGIVSFAASAKAAVVDIIIPALSFLLTVLNSVAAAINGIFGTKLTGSELAVAVVIAKAIGIFGLFSSVVRVAISAIGLLITAFGAVPIAIAAIGFAIGFVLVRALQAVDWAGFLKAATNVWTAITSSVAAVGNAIASAFDTSIQFVIGAWNGVIAFFSGIGATIGGFFNDAAILISNAFNTCVQFVLGLWNGVIAFFAAIPGVVGGIFSAVGDGIKNAFFDAVNAIKTFFTDLFQTVTNIFNAIVNAAQRVAQAVRAATGGGSSLANDAGLNSFAGGGPVRGAGTGTSDSILAWLSNREFVMNAKATSFWGEGFMHMINQMKNPFAGFSMGGLVDSMSAVGPRGLPAFAGGGMVTAGIGGAGGTPVHLHFPGGSIGPVIADADVLKAMKRMAISGGMVSAGRKPSFVGAG